MGRIIIGKGKKDAGAGLGLLKAKVTDMEMKDGIHMMRIGIYPVVF